MNQLQQRIYSNDYADVIIPYNYTTAERFLQANAAFDPQIINETYAMLHVRVLEGSGNNPAAFLYSLVPNLFTPLDTTSLEQSGILQTQTQPALQLKGKGILMGFLDTGILYSHPAFLAPGNRSRILRIWDQTIPDENNNGPFGYGTLYTQEQINQALADDNPLEIVPSTDTNGHGTFVAGVAAGTADPVSEFIGAAPESAIAVVRLKEAKQHLKDFYFFSGDVPVFQETDLMTGIQYLLDLSREVRMPLALCIALGSNQGDHSGYTPLDLSIRQLDALPGVAAIAAGGNEAGKAHHFFGTVPSQNEYQNVEIFVQENTPGFFLELWGQPPELFTVGFRSPVGETIPRIPARLGKTEVIRFFLEETKIYVNYELVQNTSGSQLIFIRFEKPTPGIWNIQVYCSSRFSGQYHMWLPISGFLSPDVTFLSPDPFTTITMPGNSTHVITASAYSAYNNSLFLNSGRGYSRTGQIKPDIAAPGVDVTGPDLRGGYTLKTGTSAAAALTAGSSALLLEWGMNQRQFQLLYTSEIKNLLIRGADRNPDEVYPNREWGYGTLNVYQVFSAISTT
ncbi:MAG: S8 family peptidase [Clostridiales bacterium]|nr:S8 family peptidase [Clostridiales bacterium]